MDPTLWTIISACAAAVSAAIVALWRQMVATQAQLVARIVSLEASRDDMASRSVAALAQCTAALNRICKILDARPCVAAAAKAQGDNPALEPHIPGEVSKAAAAVQDQALNDDETARIDLATGRNHG